MTSSQHSGQSGGSSCGNSIGYAPWIPVGPHSYNSQDNFYNNPIQYTNSGQPPSMMPNPQHRCQMTPPNQQPPPLPLYYPTQQPQQRNMHNPHYPPSHSHSDYQPYNYHNNRKCSNSR